jgi:hypothetical protein
MMNFIFVGLWGCSVTLLSSYLAAYLAAGAPTIRSEQPYLDGVEYRRLQPITVPMILDGEVRGYVIAKLIYTADASTLRKLSIDPEVFVTNEAFNEIYTHGRVEFGKLSKYNIKSMMKNVKDEVNAKLGPVVEDVLLDGINYVDKTEIKGMSSSRSSARESNTPSDATNTVQ